MTLPTNDPIPAPEPLDNSTLAGAMLASEGMLIVVIDPSGYIVHFNRACERLSGYPAAQVQGKPFWEKLVPPEHLEGIRMRLGLFAAGQPLPAGWMSAWQTAYGELRRISWTHAITPQANGGPAYLVLFGLDVTDDITHDKRTAELSQCAQRELEQSRMMLRQMIDTMPQSIFWKDRQSRYLGCNQIFARDAGFDTPEELIGKTDYDIAPPDNAARYQADDHAIMESGLARLNYDEQQNKKDGRVVWVRTSKTPLYDQGGRIYGILGIYSDITIQKTMEIKLRESEERFRNAFEHAAVGIVQVGPDRRFLHINPRMCEILGYSEEELLARTFDEITYPDDLPICRENAVNMLDGKQDIFTTEKRYIRKDGSLVWAQITASLVRDAQSEPRYFVTIVEDISERKRAQALLEERTRDLARSNADLEQFAYLTSHDLQEPLRMVSSFTQLLDRRYRGQLDNRADDYIHYITEGAQRMQRLINDLLAYSRVGSRGRPFAPLEFENVLSQVVDNLQIAIEEAGVSLTHEPLPRIYGDEIQLIQLMQNLIGNAIKFRSANPAQIHISASQQGKEWIFAVRDNGIGIDSQYFERIFVLFQRLHLREEYPGTGIGLAICKRIIERHNGRIWVESTPEQGSTFYFSLPAV
jgi:PAS domain S-box-containing protein